VTTAAAEGVVLLVDAVEEKGVMFGWTAVAGLFSAGVDAGDAAAG
jgi:hypothetical protein